ncbi:ferritin family protein [Bdellovibrionota bacterium]
MPGTFTITEIFKISMKIEENGQKFYTAYAQKTDSPEVERIFKYLASQEAEHYDLFRKMTSELKPEEEKIKFPGDTELYLKAIAEEGVFKEDKQWDKLLDRIATEDDALHWALELESDSIIFYETMKKTVPNRNHKLIDRIIRQENGHYKMIQDFIAKRRAEIKYPSEASPPMSSFRKRNR